MRTGDVNTLISKGAIVLNTLDGQRSIQKTNCEYGIIENRGAVKGVFHMLIPSDQTLPVTSEPYSTHLGNCSERIQIMLYERDVQNFADACKLGDRGLEMVDCFALELPRQLDPTAEVIYQLTLNDTGVFDINVSVTENDKPIVDGSFEVSHNNLG